LRLNIVVTNLIRRRHAAKLAILPGPKRLFLKDRLRPRGRPVAGLERPPLRHFSGRIQCSAIASVSFASGTLERVPRGRQKLRMRNICQDRVVSDRHEPLRRVRHLGELVKRAPLACPNGDLVFPTGTGTVEALSNIVQRGLAPVQVAAGVVTAEGRAKYTGLHALRHFYATGRPTAASNCRSKRSNLASGIQH
jgi:hypothetical protein